MKRWTVLLLLLAASPVGAENAPLLLNFQGRLTNSVGTPVTAAMTVRFTVIQGGTAGEAVSSGTTVYQEDQTVDPNDSGVFVHVIGSGTPIGGQTLEEADFITSGLPLYVEMQISGETLLPRTAILSTGYAIEASRLDGKSASEIIGQAGGNAFVNEVVRHGAELEFLSPSQITIKSGTLGFPDAKVRRNSAVLTWDFANGVGLLGLDAGSEAASTWYYLYAVPDPGNDSQFSAVASTNTPTQIGGAGPAAYGVHRFLGAFLNSASSNVAWFFQRDRRFYWNTRIQEYDSGIVTADIPRGTRTLTSVPATARTALLLSVLEHNGTTGCNVHMNVYIAGQTFLFHRLDAGGKEFDLAASQYEIPLPDGSPKTVDSEGTSDCNNVMRRNWIWTVGWEDASGL